MYCRQLDKLIDAVNANGTIEMLYSTPATYIAAKYAENVSLPLRYDDAMPYGTNNHDYWYTATHSAERATHLLGWLLTSLFPLLCAAGALLRAGAVTSPVVRL